MPGYKPFKMNMKSYGQGKNPIKMGHKEAPNKFLGGLIGKAKQMGSKMLKGNDGKFGAGDAARLALGPMGALAGGLFMKEKPTGKMGKAKPKKEELNEFGETRAQYIKRMEDMGLRKPDKKKPSPTKAGQTAGQIVRRERLMN
tara:strand:- start:5537 stop:5965 length:429 start_codon:yes stop_codon:yes gene_type:complete